MVDRTYTRHLYSVGLRTINLCIKMVTSFGNVRSHLLGITFIHRYSFSQGEIRHLFQIRRRLLHLTYKLCPRGDNLSILNIPH